MVTDRWNPFKWPSSNSWNEPVAMTLSPTISGTQHRQYEEMLRQADMMRNTMPKESITEPGWRTRMVRMRLHLDTMTKMPFADFHTALAGDKVFVFFVHKNEPIVLTDEAAMFPSDAFITQLRLLMD